VWDEEYMSKYFLKNLLMHATWFKAHTVQAYGVLKEDGNVTALAPPRDG